MECTILTLAVKDCMLIKVSLIVNVNIFVALVVFKCHLLFIRSSFNGLLLSCLASYMTKLTFLSRLFSLFFADKIALSICSPVG